MPGEMTDEDLVTVPKKATAYDQSGGSGHVEGGGMVIPNLLREGEPEPVDDWATIIFGSGVGDAPSEISPRLIRHEVPLKEHYHIRIKEVNFPSYSDIVHSHVFGCKFSQNIHLGVSGQDRVYRLAAGAKRMASI